MRGRLKREPGWSRNIDAARRHLDPLPADISSAGGVWAVGLVRNEADIVATTVTNLLAQGIERVIIADNLSDDETKPMLEDMARHHPITVLVDRLAAHYQAEKITLLAREAARAGASWVIPFDADEIWLATEGGTVAQWLSDCRAPTSCRFRSSTMFRRTMTMRPNPTPCADCGGARRNPIACTRWHFGRIHAPAWPMATTASRASANGLRAYRSGTSRTAAKRSSSASSIKVALPLPPPTSMPMWARCGGGSARPTTHSSRRHGASSLRNRESPVRVVGAASGIVEDPVDVSHLTLP